MTNEKTRIATDIETDLFYKILKFLKENGWKLTAEYDPEIFDKAIDFDLYELTKGEASVLMVWDIWFGGEIRTQEAVFEELSVVLPCEFSFGKPEHFHKDNLLQKSPLVVRY
ncbi:hypothetical protein [Capnocytophaga sp.]|uniref:hypothetical protein n=1 Tax=Capnocytophaga sp. TaxID=44737 RepID=UPI0026DCA41E|nr:hypothetical protein [Capnocytophaga sp.]MDO5105628.1 hypothetical protein [Capnocytophaga sp.]